MTRATTHTIRPLTCQLSNIVPPDLGARHGWIYIHVGAAASKGTWRDHVRFTAVLEHITAGAGMDVRGIG